MRFDPIAYLQQPRWSAMRLGLDRVRALLEGLGRPQDRTRFVHVAGTNGKGSVCAYISSVLRESGYRTGCLTSPFIERFEEQIRVDGECIAPDELLRATLAVREVADAMDDHPTEFELVCAVALLHFAQSACDIVVLEVGLGGRWDATNVIELPDVCVITRIGLDHTELLGDSAQAIAREKAGIVKCGTSVVTCPQEYDAREVLEDICVERQVNLVVMDESQLDVEPLRLGLESNDACDVVATASGGASCMRRFSYKGLLFETALLATYQPYNAALALEAVDALRRRGWNLPEQAVRDGIAAARWPGRFEVVCERPLVIVDGGHNLQGAQALAESLREVLPGVRPVFVVGTLKDKDYRGMMREVASLGSFFVTVTPDNPRALSAEHLAETIRAMQPADAVGGVVTARTMREAVAMALDHAGEAGVVCAFGSLYSIKAFKEVL